jgi:hypothetical protein
MRGGKSTGALVKSGFFTKKAFAERKRMVDLNREIRELLCFA